jgi:4-amino-4-deoxy-L-arabinose transferase-like glycosyltransferase
VRTRQERTLIGGVLAVALLVNAWGLSAVGWGNAYYSAAVRSMGSSWHNFFYASLDAGGYVSVDKPPLALWVQVVSSKIFGYSRLAVLLPEVLAGALAVGLLFWGLRRTWGVTAALVGAAALAVTPISVMVNHSNNTDALLAMLMTAAAVCTMEAIRAGRLRWLLAACAFAGAAMTTKMLAAAPVMPGLLLAYGWCAPAPWRRRLRDVAIGAVTLAGVGLWWFVAVQATPAADRPYVGSTRTNSVFELAFERNGVRQVEGISTLPLGPRDRERAGAFVGLFPGATADRLLPPTPDAAVAELPVFIDGARPRAGIGGLGFNSGNPGVDRLTNRELGAQIGWLVPFALIAAIGALWSTGYRRSPRLGAVVVLGCWFAAEAIVLSFTKGVVHPYYMAGLAPPTAGLVGIGAATFRSDLAGGRRRALLAALALALTGWAEWVIWRRFEWRTWMSIVGAVAVVGVLVAGARLWRGRDRAAHLGGGVSSRVALTIVAAGIAALLLPPLAWTQGSLAAGVNATLPFAQPIHAGRAGTIVNQITPNGGFQFPSLSVPALETFLREHAAGERWLLAVQSAAPAEEVIIPSGLPVMAIGGFIGSDPIESARDLQDRVRNGEVRYFLISVVPGGVVPGLFGDTDVVSWIPERCAEVPNQVWEGRSPEDTAEPGTQAFPGGPTAANFQLFDCAGLRSAGR